MALVDGNLTANGHSVLKKGMLMGLRLSWKQEFYIPPHPSSNELRSAG